jgi:hypothetical protein
VIAVTIHDSAIMPEAFFTVDGDSYLPGVMTRGPWGAVMGGQIIGGLLGWGIEQSGIAPEFVPARFTVDLLRPVPLEPVQIQTSVQRDGRRIKLIDGALLQNGRTVARASALFMRRGEHPEGEVWSASVHMPPLPTGTEGFPVDMPFLIWGYGNSLAGSPGIAAGEWEQAHSQKFAWTRLFRPMVHGHPLTPFTRLAFVGDVASSLTHWGTGGLRYINADYKLPRAGCQRVNTLDWRLRATLEPRVLPAAAPYCSISTVRSAPPRRWPWPSPPTRSGRSISRQSSVRSLSVNMTHVIN